MHIRFALVMAGTVLFAAPAFAGTVTIANGQITWRSTQCVAPTAPSVAAPDAEIPANDLNARVAAYNSYAHAAQDYMNCLSTEAGHDAGVVSQSIVNQAKAMIDDANSKVETMGAPFRPMAPAAAPAPAPAPTVIPAEPEPTPAPATPSASPAAPAQ